jgi:alpha/beta superfamily hydrolase
VDERRFYIEAGDVQLEAVLHLPDGVPPFAGVVVCHPHPRYGGDMNNNVVLAVTRALTDRGIAALRFNFRGVGGSAGSYDDGRGETEDAQHALDALASREEID